MVIDELFSKEIGGTRQWISILAEDIKKPILLMLHGGPGTPCMRFFRKHNRDLTRHFIMVTWDQRGTGRSYSSKMPLESMTLNQLVEDTHELTLYLKTRFNRDKVFILGHSFGATLALQVINKYPEDYHAYFAVSQFVHAERNEAESYAFAMKKAKALGDNKSLKKLYKIGEPVHGFYKGGLKDTMVEKAIISKFKGDTYQRGSSLALIFGLLFSKEYGYHRFFKSLKGIKFSLEHLGKSLEGINYFLQIPKVDIPIYFFSGRHDYLTPQNILMEYYHKLSAPHKELIVFENSAHSPLWEEANVFNRKIIEIGRAHV